MDADNGLIIYEKRKDYSSLRIVNCEGIACSPCAPITKVECINNQCQKCVGEGGSINTMSGPKGEIIGPRCCDDLTQIAIISKEGEEWFELADGALCTKCGDGLCKEPENIKNCLVDCKEIPEEPL